MVVDMELGHLWLYQLLILGNCLKYSYLMDDPFVVFIKERILLTCLAVKCL